MTRLLVLAVLVLATLAAPALAQEPAEPSSDRPTSEGQPADAAPTVELTPAPAPVTAQAPPVSRASEPDPYFFAGGYGSGVAATAFTLPATVVLASWVGTLANGIVAAAIPGLLTLLLLPPILTTLAVWTFANLSADGGFKLLPAFWAALGTHAVVVIAAGLLGAAANQPSDMILLTVADALLMPAATMAVMQRTRAQAAPGMQLRWEF